MMMFSSSRNTHNTKTSDIIDDDQPNNDNNDNDQRNNVIISTDDEIKSKKSGCNWSLCCTILCRLLSICNTVLICLLIAMVLWEYERIQALEAMMPLVQDEIKDLEEEVQTKQQSQIQQLNQEVEEEHNLTFLTLAGIFTLLTCLITTFHMSTHLQKMNQPIIQRKIVAILWMSPIYGVTSFLSLIYPPMDGYLAIIKDFYESYCIYNFLAFLIAVLGKGSREKAVEVLARHSDHMDEPTRCLSRWYDPPPSTSNFAKANAVMLECQIKAMQFVFIRPLTTVMYVLHKSVNIDDSINEGDDNNTASNGTSYNNDSSTFMPTNRPTMTVDNSIIIDGQGSNNADDISINNNGTRWLQNDDQINLFDDTATNTNQTSSWLETFAPTVAPTMEEMFFNTFSPSDDDEFATSAPLFSSNDTGIMDDNNLGQQQQQTQPGDFGEATKAYFKSFGFVLAMIVNISVFFAFAGLLKFYHAAQEDLKWCRPWPKFLTIKGVVFMTFWQGLTISIIVNLNSDDDDASEQAQRYQNILICIEMLLFSLTHWCVFPAEEWQKDYKPPEKNHKPGIGIQDFVSDVGYIVKSRTQRRKNRRKSRFGRNTRGLYHKPMATAEDMQQDYPPPEVEMIPTSNAVVDGTHLSSTTKLDGSTTTNTNTGGSPRQRSFSDSPYGQHLTRRRSFSDGFDMADDGGDDDDDSSSDDLSLL